MAALRAAIEKYTAVLEPNQLPPGDPWRGSRSTTFQDEGIKE